MGRSAESKLDRADFLNEKASKLRKKDPDSARELDALARASRKSAIKQLKRRPKRKGSNSAVVLGG
ncbi:hypothetical protein LCGC14_2039910 [marine sediment metagenome]|uniref:Uncharacterized protein n=1 Tax=marine sediment metagenome TaxID=412755 RepID=A0A0F9HP92_9ZZZZ